MENNLRRYASAVGSVAAGLAVRLALGGLLGSSVPYITLYPAVAFAALYGGIGPGILAMVLSLGAVLYYLLPQYHRVTFQEDAVRAVLFVVCSTGFCIFNEALRRARATSERDRELLHITLSSIGDAVISTDAQGKVTFLNDVAQQLTGWSQQDAVGKPIAEVFVVTNEKTGLKAEIPVEKVMREGVVANLANHTVLHARDGREIPIEDSAAAIRGVGRGVVGAVLAFRDVTERRRSEDALRTSEERLKLALGAGQIGVWDYDVARDQVEWSDHVYAIHGVERGAFGGTRDEFIRLVHPEDRQRIGAAIAGAIASGGHYEAEYRCIHPNGDLHWITAAGTVHRDEQGEATRMVGALTDVTRGKQAEEQLRQQWHIFDTALSHTPDFTYVFDLEGRFTYVNRALLSLWQKPLEEAVGRNFFDLGYPAELAERLQKQIQSVIETKEVVRDHTPFTGPDGDTGYYEYILVPIETADGRVEAVAGSTRDITERRIAEEMLRASEERFRVLAECIPQMIWTANAAGALDYVSGQTRAYFDQPAASLLGDGWLDGVHADDREQAAEQWKHSIAAGEPYETAFRLRRGSDGSYRWHLTRALPVSNDSGRIVQWFGTCTDIEDQKVTEADLTRVNRELEEFAYVASHDLQEPLRMVNIYTQLISDDINRDGTAIGRYAGFVRQGVTRMEGLIQDLLTFSRAVHSDRLPVGSAELSPALAEATVVLRNRMEECHATLTADSLPKVRGDAAQMAHVFQNLLSNSLKYCKDGLAPAIHVSARQEGKNWIISVADNGIGFDPRYAERIFGLFKRLYKEEYPGTGLGLAICKRIVERYGGRIWAEGRPGEGATFYFSLPGAE